MAKFKVFIRGSTFYYPYWGTVEAPSANFARGLAIRAYNAANPKKPIDPMFVRVDEVKGS